jgi:hypothetical protein
MFLRVIGCWLVFLVPLRCFGNSDAPVFATLAETGDTYNISAEFTSPVDQQIAWNVLTDYDDMSKFIASIHGHIRSEKGDDLLVHQVATGGFFIFSVSVEALLKIHEEPMTSIHFTDISGKDFKSYSGVWTMRVVPGAVNVTYQLEAERNKHTPGFVNGEVLRSSTGNLLKQVRTEMERREAKIQKENISATNTPAHSPATVLSVTPTIEPANMPIDVLINPPKTPAEDLTKK